MSRGGPPEVVVRGPRLTDRLFGRTQLFVAGALETLVLLYFLLAVGDLFLQKLKLLWGALAALAEFIPYLGSTTLLLTLALAGLVTFPSVSHALLVPVILGRRLTLNPVAILVRLIFWWWIWGVAGAFIAVPLLATLKIFCDHIESPAPIGEFLGD